jgi:rSAM/selenodomain-associated transferase 2
MWSRGAVAKGQAGGARPREELMPLSPSIGAPSLGIVIPALNAARHLEATVGSLAPGRERGLLRDIVLVDGGSTDGTPDLARSLGCRVLTAPRGRGHQLRVGGDAGGGRWLLFLHADTRLSAEWAMVSEDFMRGPTEDRAAVFRLRLDDEAPAARRLERLVTWRTRALGLPYGDQGLLIPTALYRSLGGFAPIPLMEDVDIVRRLGRRRIALLDADAVTSAERYRRAGYLGRSTRNLSILALYFLGVPPARLARLYG